MTLWDSLLGRSKPAPSNLDNLFAVPQAALTLQAGAGFTPTGVGAVCYRANEGAAFAAMQTDVQQLLDADGGPAVVRSQDSYGFTWLECRQDPGAVEELVTELHAVNSTLQDSGFGPSLLCSLVGFTGPDAKPLALVYLYKRGTFYPFAPAGEPRRDNALELQVRGLVAGDVPIEKDLNRWLALWGAPGLG
ncbi:MAG: PspA-associated protein PspAB [Nocardioidaceae bacterium]